MGRKTQDWYKKETMIKKQFLWKPGNLKQQKNWKKFKNLLLNQFEKIFTVIKKTIWKIDLNLIQVTGNRPKVDISAYQIPK